MKKRLLIVFLTIVSLLCVSMGLTACTFEDYSGFSVKDVTIEEGDTKNLSVKFVNAKEEELVFEYEGDKIGIRNNAVTGYSAGKTVVKARTESGKYEATFNVVVLKSIANDYGFTAEDINIMTDGKAEIVLKFADETRNDPILNVTYDEEKLAVTEENGKWYVSAKAAGEDTSSEVTVNTGFTTAKLTVTVTGYGRVSVEDMLLEYDGSAKIAPVFTKEEYKEALTYTFEGNDIRIENGVVYAVNDGTETIVTAKSAHFETSFKVTVKENPGYPVTLGLTARNYRKIALGKVYDKLADGTNYTLNGTETYTGSIADGKISIEQVKNGEYILKIDGYKDEIVTVNGGLTDNIVLTAKPLDVTGSVTAKTEADGNEYKLNAKSDRVVLPDNTAYVSFTVKVNGYTVPDNKDACGLHILTDASKNQTTYELWLYRGAYASRMCWDGGKARALTAVQTNKLTGEGLRMALYVKDNVLYGYTENDEGVLTLTGSTTPENGTATKVTYINLNDIEGGVTITDLYTLTQEEFAGANNMVYAGGEGGTAVYNAETKSITFTADEGKTITGVSVNGAYGVVGANGLTTYEYKLPENKLEYAVKAYYGETAGLNLVEIPVTGKFAYEKTAYALTGETLYTGDNFVSAAAVTNGKASLYLADGEYTAKLAGSDEVKFTVSGGKVATALVFERKLVNTITGAKITAEETSNGVTLEGKLSDDRAFAYLPVYNGKAVLTATLTAKLASKQFEFKIKNLKEGETGLKGSYVLDIGEWPNSVHVKWLNNNSYTTSVADSIASNNGVYTFEVVLIMDGENATGVSRVLKTDGTYTDWSVKTFTVANPYRLAIGFGGEGTWSNVKYYDGSGVDNIVPDVVPEYDETKGSVTVEKGEFAKTATTVRITTEKYCLIDALYINGEKVEGVKNLTEYVYTGDKYIPVTSVKVEYVEDRTITVTIPVSMKFLYETSAYAAKDGVEVSLTAADGSIIKGVVSDGKVTFKVDAGSYTFGIEGTESVAVELTDAGEYAMPTLTRKVIGTVNEKFNVKTEATETAGAEIGYVYNESTYVAGNDNFAKTTAYGDKFVVYFTTSTKCWVPNYGGFEVWSGNERAAIINQGTWTNDNSYWLNFYDTNVSSWDDGTRINNCVGMLNKDGYMTINYIAVANGRTVKYYIEENGTIYYFRTANLNLDPDGFGFHIDDHQGNQTYKNIKVYDAAAAFDKLSKEIEKESRIGYLNNTSLSNHTNSIRLTSLPENFVYNFKVTGARYDGNNGAKGAHISIRFNNDDDNRFLIYDDGGLNQGTYVYTAFTGGRVRIVSDPNRYAFGNINEANPLSVSVLVYDNNAYMFVNDELKVMYYNVGKVDTIQLGSGQWENWFDVDYKDNLVSSPDKGTEVYEKYTALAEDNLLTVNNNGTYSFANRSPLVAIEGKTTVEGDFAVTMDYTVGSWNTSATCWFGLNVSPAAEGVNKWSNLHVFHQRFSDGTYRIVGGDGNYDTYTVWGTSDPDALTEAESNGKWKAFIIRQNGIIYSGFKSESNLYVQTKTSASKFDNAIVWLETNAVTATVSNVKTTKNASEITSAMTEIGITAPDGNMKIGKVALAEMDSSLAGKNIVWAEVGLYYQDIAYDRHTIGTAFGVKTASGDLNNVFGTWRFKGASVEHAKSWLLAWQGMADPTANLGRWNWMTDASGGDCIGNGSNKAFVGGKLKIAVAVYEGNAYGFYSADNGSTWLQFNKGNPENSDNEITGVSYIFSEAATAYQGFAASEEIPEYILSEYFEKQYEVTESQDYKAGNSNTWTDVYFTKKGYVTGDFVVSFNVENAVVANWLVYTAYDVDGSYGKGSSWAGTWSIFHQDNTIYDKYASVYTGTLSGSITMSANYTVKIVRYNGTMYSIVTVGETTVYAKAAIADSVKKVAFGGYNSTGSSATLTNKAISQNAEDITAALNGII